MYSDFYFNTYYFIMLNLVLYYFLKTITLFFKKLKILFKLVRQIIMRAANEASYSPAMIGRT